MTRVTVLDDLYRYHDWANRRLFQLCAGLTDAELDEARPMGFGTLRATLFHNLEAEELWFERWTGAPWRPLDTNPAGISLSELASRFRDAARSRQKMMDDERSTAWKRVVAYRDSAGNPHERPLEDLLLHVANHAVHHRAQALNFLKSFERTVPGGLDYVFYRFAHPTVAQEAGTVSALRGYGLEVDTVKGVEVDWNGAIVQRYFQYHDWACQQLFELAGPMDDAALDRPFDIGPGSIRRTLLHLYDAERWWMRNWTSGAPGFDHSPNDTPLSQMVDGWSRVARQRDEFVAAQDDPSAHRVLAVSFGGPPTRVSIIESMVQLCCHGTHHRAQVVNMLRQCGVTAPQLDFVVWCNRA